MADLLLVLLTVALFAVLAAWSGGWSGCERRQPRRPDPGRRPGVFLVAALLFPERF